MHMNVNVTNQGIESSVCVKLFGLSAEIVFLLMYFAYESLFVRNVFDYCFLVCYEIASFMRIFSF